MNELTPNQPANISEPSHISSVLSPTVAQHRIVNFMGHAVEMLDALHKQNLIEGVPADKASKVYGNAIKEIYRLNARLLDNVNQISPERDEKIQDVRKQLKNLKQKKPSLAVDKKIDELTKQLKDLETNLTKRDIKVLKESLHEAEKEIATIIHKAQVEMASEIGETWIKGTKDKVATLAEGGWGAKWIRFFSLVSRSHHNAVQAFDVARELMNAAAQQVFPSAALERVVDQDKRGEFDRFLSGKGSLDRRAGVIGLNGIYRIQVTFERKDVKKQLRSFIAQNISNMERTTLNRDIDLKEGKFTNRLIPLNTEFDKEIGIRGTMTKVFGNIFGTKGITSANREEPHLINGWETNLIVGGKRLFRSLRHAITSDKHEKNLKIREANSKKAAEELLKAALLQEIADQGLTLAQAREKRIKLNFNSVSLVTPDDLRPFLPGQADEKKMLLDQVLALQQFEGQQEIELDGIRIPVEIHNTAFNFGVNALAVKLKWGLDNQYEHNKTALEGLRSQFIDFHNHVVAEYFAAAENSPILFTDLQAKYENAQRLMQDIELLMQDEAAYLKGDNQYEIGAKILNLTNLMDLTIEMINENRTAGNKIAGYKCAFNCMSGKDRTGIMDAIAKVFAIMAFNNNGKFHSHQDFQNNPELRKTFADLLTRALLEGGSLEITNINTGAKGYKVGEEARIFGMPIDQFLQVQGLSATTSS